MQHRATDPLPILNGKMKQSTPNCNGWVEILNVRSHIENGCGGEIMYIAVWKFHYTNIANWPTPMKVIPSKHRWHCYCTGSRCSGKKLFAFNFGGNWHAKYSFSWSANPTDWLINFYKNSQKMMEKQSYEINTNTHTNTNTCTHRMFCQFVWEWETMESE